MPEYRRFIAYFYEYINGKKQKNAGFAKVELRNGMWRILFRLTTGSLPEAPVKVYGFVRESGYLLGFLIGTMRQGNEIAEEWAYRADTPIGKNKYHLEDLSGIWIQSEDQRCFITGWDDEPIDPDRFVLELPGSKPEKAEEEEPKQEQRDGTGEYGQNMEAEKELQGVENRGSIQESDSVVIAEEVQCRLPEEQGWAAPECVPHEEQECAASAEPGRMLSESQSCAEPGRMRSEEQSCAVSIEPGRMLQEEQGCAVSVEPERMLQEKQDRTMPMEARELSRKKQGCEPQERRERKPPEKQSCARSEESGYMPPEQVSQSEHGKRAVSVIEELFKKRPNVPTIHDTNITVCIQIMPCDIVRLQQEKWNVGRSSFLQHGFYQYRHLLLWKKEDGTYWLGIPGIKNPQEQYMAQMFGFDQFKSSKACECGKIFGYWCRELRR